MLFQKTETTSETQTAHRGRTATFRRELDQDKTSNTRRLGARRFKRRATVVLCQIHLVFFFKVAHIQARTKLESTLLCGNVKTISVL
jgi:hypothetical protein